MSWKDGVRVLLTLTVPIVTVGVSVPLFMAAVGFSPLPTLIEWTGFVAVLTAVLLAAGTIIPRIGGDTA